jgi:transcriptional regulator
VYVPRHFSPSDPSVVDALLRSAPLADLVSWDGEGFAVSPVPLLLVGSAAPGATLEGHLARANPHWRSLASAPASPVLAIFRGPDHYVSPAWYPSKAADPRVVPTWNYVTVHVHGTVAVHDDPAWTESLVRRLTAEHEDGRPDPWSVDDAPAEFIARQLAAIVGISLAVTRVEATWKLSQNRPVEDATSVAAALATSPSPAGHAVAAAMHEALSAREP